MPFLVNVNYSNGLSWSRRTSAKQAVKDSDTSLRRIDTSKSRRICGFAKHQGSPPVGHPVNFSDTSLRRTDISKSQRFCGFAKRYGSAPPGHAVKFSDTAEPKTPFSWRPL
jgi:hypothetical protein